MNKRPATVPKAAPYAHPTISSERAKRIASDGKLIKLSVRLEKFEEISRRILDADEKGSGEDVRARFGELRELLDSP